MVDELMSSNNYNGFVTNFTRYSIIDKYIAYQTCSKFITNIRLSFLFFIKIRINKQRAYFSIFEMKEDKNEENKIIAPSNSATAKLNYCLNEIIVIMIQVLHIKYTL